MISVSIVCVALLASTVIPVLAAQELVSTERTSYKDCNTRFPFTLKYADDYQREIEGEYPHLVHVGTNSETGLRIRCAGSLIWENVILAPASCAEIESDTYFVGLDRSIEDGELFYDQTFTIVNISKHPNYSPNSGLFDIALMRLDTNVIKRRSVLPICLWPDKELPPRSKCFHSEDAQGMTLSVFMNPITDTKCGEEYSYAYYGYASSTPVAPRCMEDEEVQTCSTYIRSHIHTRRIINGKVVPLMVGMVCKTTNVATYIRITKYREWIITALSELGQSDAASTVFNVEACSQRFNDLRVNEYDLPEPGDVVESSDVKMEFSVHTVKLLWPKNASTSVIPCFGAHVEPDAVLTLAQCASFLGVAPTEVQFYDSSVRKIREIIVHPNFTQTAHPNYNDIAIVKLDSPAGFVPTVCGWYGSIHPLQNVAAAAAIQTSFDYSIPNSTSLLVANLTTHQCKPAQYDQLQIPDDFRDKYFCFLLNTSSRQKYKIQLGAPIKMTAEYKRIVVGLNLNRCNCEIDIPMIGIRFDTHEAWLKSILLPSATKPNATKSVDALTYIDTDLEYSDRCGYADGAKGMCETIASCSSIQQRVSTSKQIVFCGNQTIVCCPQEENTFVGHVGKELKECDNHYGHLRQERYERSKMDRSLEDESPHLVEIGWIYGSQKFLDCIGYLISVRNIVTTASCLKWKSSAPNFVGVGGLSANGSEAAMFIPIRSLNYHPMYNETAQTHDIALVTLESPISPTWALFPGCVWMNRTHAPVQQRLINSGKFLFRRNYETGIRRIFTGEHEKSNVNVHQMYRSDCEAYLKRLITDSVACMILSPWTCRNYYNPTIKETSMQCVANDEFGSYSYLYNRVNEKSYNIRTPIVWNRMDNDGNRVEYLMSFFTFDMEESKLKNFEFSNFIGIAHRVSFYTDWISEML